MSRTAHRLSRKYLRSATRYTGDRKSVPLFPFRIPRDHPPCVSPSIVIEITLSLSLCSFLARAQENERRSNILLRASVRVGIWATIMWTVLARANVYVIEHL